MVTQTTKLLERQLLAIGQNPVVFAGLFDNWKNSFPAGEFLSYIFGKDGAYVRPTVGGQQYVLMHVHLVPLIDQRKLKAWKRVWRFRGRKSSDRALVYVTDKTYGHLLIAILDEPRAHEIAKMKTPADVQMMMRLATVAQSFKQSGAIII